MKKIIFFCSAIVAAVGLVVAAEKKQDEQAKSASTSTHQIVSPDDIKWGDVPPGLPAGAQAAVLYGDPGKAGNFTVRLKASAGYKVMPHTHPTAERLTIISGTFRLGMGDKFDEKATQEMGPGSYADLPSGMSHFAFIPSGAVVQIDSEGPFMIKYVDPKDDPRSAQK